jgi:hypothetical protein
MEGELFEVFPVMAPSEASDATLRGLVDALDGGLHAASSDDAAAELGAHPDPSVTGLLREHLARATRDVGVTELPDELRATLAGDRLHLAEGALSRLQVPLFGRVALVRRIARALAMRRDDEGWRDLARVAAEHPSRALRYAVAGALLGERENGSERRARHAPVEHLEGLADALEGGGTDTWSLTLHSYAAEAVMVIDPARAFERLSAHLGFAAPGDSAQEYRVRGIANAWHVRMRPEDDPRLARALAEHMTDAGTLPVTLCQTLKQRPHPAIVDGALAALERATVGPNPTVHYLYELLGALGDRRAALPIVRSIEAHGEAVVPHTAFRALELLDEPATLAPLQALAATRKGSRADHKALRQLVKHLSRDEKKAKRTELQPVAPGLPVWYAPPPLAAPATGDAALDALLTALPHDDAVKALAKRRDALATQAMGARFIAAAEGVCDYTWNETLVQALPSPLKGKARRAHSALYGPMNDRLTLVRVLATDLARRWDAVGDEALATTLAAHPYRELRALVAKAVVAAEPSRGLLEKVAARFDEATDHDTLVAAAAASLALGDDVAFERFGAVLGTSRRAQADAAVQALAQRLTARSDRRWTALLIADLAASQHPFAHFGAFAALRDPAAVDAIGEAIGRLLVHGAGVESGVRALHQIGDPRGAVHVLRVLESQLTSTWFRETAEVLRKLDDRTLLPRVRALHDELLRSPMKTPAREPEALEAIMKAWG